MKYHYTVYKKSAGGKLSNKENLNDNELDKWMNKVYGKFASVRVERNDGNVVEYTDNGKKFVVTKRTDKKGRVVKEDITDKIDNLLTEGSSAFAMDRGKELHDILMKSDVFDKLEDAGMRTQKEAAKIFQQAIRLLKGLK